MFGEDPLGCCSGLHLSGNGGIGNVSSSSSISNRFFLQGPQKHPGQLQSSSVFFSLPRLRENKRIADELGVKFHPAESVGSRTKSSSIFLL